MPGLSFMFPVGRKLFFDGGQNVLNWTLWKELSPRWSNQADKIILTACHFAQYLALNKTPKMRQ